MLCGINHDFLFQWPRWICFPLRKGLPLSDSCYSMLSSQNKRNYNSFSHDKKKWCLIPVELCICCFFFHLMGILNSAANVVNRKTNEQWDIIRPNASTPWWFFALWIRLDWTPLFTGIFCNSRTSLPFTAVGSHCVPAATTSSLLMDLYISFSSACALMHVMRSYMSWKAVGHGTTWRF